LYNSHPTFYLDNSMMEEDVFVGSFMLNKSRTIGRVFVGSSAGTPLCIIGEGGAGVIISRVLLHPRLFLHGYY
jgi:hypothetical protein